MKRIREIFAVYLYSNSDGLVQRYQSQYKLIFEESIISRWQQLMKLMKYAQQQPAEFLENL